MKMLKKIAYIFCLWTISEMFLTWCSELPHPSNDLHREVAHRNHSEEALKRLLRVFGLDGKVPPANSLFLPPQYMLDLYKSFSEVSTSAEQKLRHRRANTVRSFFDKEFTGETSEKGIYFYDLSESIPKHEEIVDAEFHFFTNLNAMRSQQGSSMIQIQLYEEQQKNTSKLLQARMVTAQSSGWEVFRIKASAKKWFSNPELNRGLLIKVLDSTGHDWPLRKVHRLQNHRRPILIVFSRDPRRIKETMHRPLQDSTSLHSISAKDKLGKQNNSAMSSARSPRSATIPESELCTRHELRVDFDRLGWSSWIISPKWYDAFVCSGACAFPLGQNQRPTNHATVQSIVHELGLTDGINPPCCVPTELHPVSLLYFDEHLNVVLKQYEDMVAAGCGCQ